MKPGAVVDLVGLVQSVSELYKITRRDGHKHTHKRTISLADTSGCSIDVTLWGTIGSTEGGHQLEQLMLGGEPVFVACKGLRIVDLWGRRSLMSSMGSATNIAPNADVPEMAELRRWHAAGGKARHGHMSVRFFPGFL